MATFRAWLRDQRRRNDPIGDLARDVERDSTLSGLRLTPAGLLEHVRGTAAEEAAREAAAEFGEPIPEENDDQ